MWPFAPIGERIERALDEWLNETARAPPPFPIPAMRELRDWVTPSIRTWHTTCRPAALTIERPCARWRRPRARRGRLRAFFAARNQVDLYPDSEDALKRIAARVPIAAVTNGNADLGRIGLRHHFAFQLGAGEHGKAKPSACIFHAACERLHCEHGQVLHVGDHIESDVAGAARAGLRTCWINRDGRTWRHDHITPDLEFDSLAGLADWIEAGSPQDRSTNA